MNRTELAFLLWDVPIWVLNEIKYSIYNRVMSIAVKIGIDPWKVM